MPAVIAVIIFVVCVFVILKILRAIRRNRLVAAYTVEPETPRMWEVHLDTAIDPSFEGKWNEVMVSSHGVTRWHFVSTHLTTRS